MDIELGRHLVRTGFRLGRELEALMAYLRERLAEDEYRPMAKAIALAVHEIHNATLEPAFSAHPELEAEVEAALKVRDRY